VHRLAPAGPWTSCGSRSLGRSETEAAPIRYVAELVGTETGSERAIRWLARAGATLPEISAVTGHSLTSIHNIMKHYLAVTPELGDAAIAKLMAWMEREGVQVA
jgi:hypothetical protein